MRSKSKYAHRRLPLACTLLAVGISGCAVETPMDLESRVRARINETDAEVVGVYYKNLATGDSLLIDADTRVHAASMMKVPVMIQLFRDAEAGISSLDDSLIITKTFKSIVDGSPYDLGAPDDSDTTLYARLGESETVRQLTELMITVSSNLATNMLIEHVGAPRVQATMRELGADSIAVLRGVEDIKAYEAGLSNTTTARDLGVVFSAIAEGRAGSRESCREMVEILARQQFDQGIPAGLPAGTRVAHKTGTITEIRHDGGIVYVEDGPAFVLVVLTKGIADPDVADGLIADISRIHFEHSAPGRLASDEGSADAAIAITIDDLPWNGPSPPEGRGAATDRLLDALTARGVRATCFVVCERLAAEDTLIDRWLQSGMTLGNHSYGHRDLNDTPLQEWLEDVRRCDGELRLLTGSATRYFRYPYLHQGTTAERRDAALAMLSELGYRIAHVSVDNSEWILARPYDEALQRGDADEQRRIGQLFVEHIIEQVRHSQEVARRKVGRDIKHILLLHANALVADHLPALLDRLAAEGFRFVSLDEALEDPAYALEDAYVGTKGLSWLYRLEPYSEEDVAWDDAQAASLRSRLTKGGDAS